jgi:hypothetical protein
MVEIGGDQHNFDTVIKYSLCPELDVTDMFIFTFIYTLKFKSATSNSGQME